LLNFRQLTLKVQVNKEEQGEMSDASEMIFRTIQCFRDDGMLDVNELNQVVKIALDDGVVDEAEKKVLKDIICNLTSKDLTIDMWERVEQLISHYQLDD
jgi:hypothetical protein